MPLSVRTDLVPVESGPPAENPAPDVGSAAPLFTLPDADMEEFELAEELSQHIVVLSFYPRDGTPGRIKLAIEFSDREHEFEREGAIVVGVSLDDVLTHAIFRDAHGLSMRLLSDSDFDVCRLYGVLQQHEGEHHPTVNRTTFIIGRDGIVRHVLRETCLRGHVAEVLDLVRKLAGNSNGNSKKHRGDIEL